MSPSVKSYSAGNPGERPGHPHAIYLPGVDGPTQPPDEPEEEEGAPPRDRAGLTEEESGTDEEASGTVAHPRTPSLTEADGPVAPYSVFSKSTKLLIVALCGAAGTFSPISSTIFVPAIPTLSNEFHKSEQQISLAVTMYLIFQALTPSFFGTLSDSIGRRPVYIVTLTIYFGANIGLALVPTNAYWLLLVLRMVQATGGTSMISIGSGCVADIAEARERGRYMSYFQLGAMSGPALGPLLGGAFAQVNWRWMFWFLAIATGAMLVPLIIFVPETLRHIVGNGSIPPPALNMSPAMLVHFLKEKKIRKARGEEMEIVERPPPRPFNPLTPFMTLFQLEILLTFIALSTINLHFYCIITLFSTVLQEKYHLNDIKIGLSYLPQSAGIVISILFSGRYTDWLYRREEARVGGGYKEKGDEFRLERTRFFSIIPTGVIFLTSNLAFGWCLEVKAPLPATLVMSFLTGTGGSIVSLSMLYGQDLRPARSGAVSASANLVRCMLAAVGTAVIQMMYRSIGAGWSMVLLTGICLSGIPLLFIVARYGPKWRVQHRAREERKAAKKAEKQAEKEAEKARNKAGQA